MKFAVWYMKPEWFREGIMGEKPDLAKLEETHTYVTEIELATASLSDTWRELEHIYASLNSDFGLAPELPALIRAKGLKHTSMSVGDVVRYEDKTYVVARFGFERLMPEGVADVVEA